MAKKLTTRSKGLTVELFAEPEDLQIEGNACATDDPEADQKCYDWINSQLARGNVWAWFSAHVRVTYTIPGTDVTLTADDYLGGCSYRSEKDFRRDGYFRDMVGVCVDDLNTQIARREHFDACDHCKTVSAASNASKVHAAPSFPPAIHA